MITREEIDQESSTLDAITIKRVVSEIRGTSFYVANPGLFSTLSDKLTTASGTPDGKMVNALLAKISILGDAGAVLSGGSDGITYSQKQVKLAFLEYLASLFYPVIKGVTGIDVSVVSIDDILDSGALSDYKSGDRSARGEFV